MPIKSKIARLPHHLRHALNNDLQDGLPASVIAQRINAIPEVQKILQDQFHGRAITEQNLSDWRQGGFLQWQEQQNNRSSAEGFLENASVLKEALGEEQAGGCLLPQLALTLHQLSQKAASGVFADQAEEKRFFRVANQILQLRRAEQHDQKLKLDERRVAALEMRRDEARLYNLPRTFEAALDVFIEGWKSNGHTVRSASAASAALVNYFNTLTRARHSIPAPPPVPAACGERVTPEESRAEHDAPSGAQDARASRFDGLAAFVPAAPAPDAEAPGELEGLQVTAAPSEQEAGSPVSPATFITQSAGPTLQGDPGNSRQPSGSEIACEGSPKGRDGDLGQLGVAENLNADTQLASGRLEANPDAAAEPASTNDPGQSRTEHDAPWGAQLPEGFAAPSASTAPATQPDDAKPLGDPGNSRVLVLPEAKTVLSKEEAGSHPPSKTEAPFPFDAWTDGIEDLPEFFPEYDESHFRELATA